ncbi:MAG: hypothetical protein JJ855_04300 [Rhodospirillales bacterium]|nr:hypothetical protein [Rhodospirillales bacterium]
MKYRVHIKIRKTSWGGRKFPRKFQSYTRMGKSENLDYLQLLHTIGKITVPPISNGFSLAEYWAQLRYVHAIDCKSKGLLLSPQYAELDPHQKTILSDDFGMGISMYWLEKKMCLRPPIEGYYYIKNSFGRYGRKVLPKNIAKPRPAKRGPRKSPDFIAEDASGFWHVIECKGTQSGTHARAKQIKRGKGQKTTILFPRSVRGERLVAATKIAISGSGDRTELLIEDPSEEPILQFSESYKPYLSDPLFRGTVAKVLSLVGARQLGRQLASPSGLIERPFHQTWKERSNFVEARRASLEQELKELKIKSGQISREMSTELVQPIIWGSRTYRSATLRYRCDSELIDSARELGDSDEPIESGSEFWKRATDITRFESNLQGRTTEGPSEAFAKMKIGEFFVSELILR